MLADDNAQANRDNLNAEEGGYTIDNVSFVPPGIFIPLSVGLTAPPNGVYLLSPATIDATTTITATTTGPALSSFGLDLEGLTVGSVTVDGVAATASRIEEADGVKPGKHTRGIRERVVTQEEARYRDACEPDREAHDRPDDRDDEFRERRWGLALDVRHTTEEEEADLSHGQAPGGRDERMAELVSQDRCEEEQ